MGPRSSSCPNGTYILVMMEKRINTKMLRVSKMSSGEAKNNKELVLYSIYSSLLYVSKQFLEYSIEIDPTAHYKDERSFWDSNIFSALLNLGASTLEYGVPSGKHFLLGSIMAQDILIKISDTFKNSWPNPPKIDEIVNALAEWYFANIERLPGDLDSLKIVCRGLVLLIKSLAIYAKTLLSRTEKSAEHLKLWDNIIYGTINSLERSIIKRFEKFVTKDSRTIILRIIESKGNEVSRHELEKVLKSVAEVLEISYEDIRASFEELLSNGEIVIDNDKFVLREGVTKG